MLWILLLLALGVRTALWHLRCWQLREYRLDRMKAWLATADGKVFWYPWIKPGLLPRPKISGRILMIVAILGLLNLGLLLTTYYLLPTTLILTALLVLLWERTLWLQVGISVLLSGIPARWKKLKLFTQAGAIVATNPEIIRIGITGSYGKSSTKEVLVHLLKDHFEVLYNPANHNNEVAIARLIIDNQDFFVPNGKKKVLVIETGAYKKGEIGTVCGFIDPQIGILTGLNQQHIELFGSQQNIADAKFELPAAVSQKVFFNADNDLLVQLFADRQIKATKIPVSTKAAQDLKAEQDKSHFNMYDQSFTLPWPGVFFVENTLLALECCRELGIKPDALSKSLTKLPPLERALSLETHAQGFTILKDTYSANVDGVLQAIAHFKNFSGKKIFIGMPLRELGKEAERAHRQIFESLKSSKADVYWAKSDFAKIGKDILGPKFNLLSKDASELTNIFGSLGPEDVVLLESKLPDSVTTQLS